MLNLIQALLVFNAGPHSTRVCAIDKLGLNGLFTFLTGILIHTAVTNDIISDKRRSTAIDLVIKEFAGLRFMDCLGKVPRRRGGPLLRCGVNGP